MAKPVYERGTKRLSPNDVQSAISYSQSAKIVGRIAEWRDLKTVGLTLRITPRQAVWYVRRRDITLRLGFSQQILGPSIPIFSFAGHKVEIATLVCLQYTCVEEMGITALRRFKRWRFGEIGSSL
jgi:hypothetical protein